MLLSLARHRGFTLIEVMITVAIISILTLVALPSYRDYVVRANRSAAASYLQEVANLQERNFLDERSYATSMLDLGATVPSQVEQNYTVTTVADNAATPPSYTVSAAPKSNQAGDDDCGTLTLNSQGQQGYAAGATRCWN
ncbi:type IV pilin protein [Zhongshania arctica]|uniref:Type IV pilin protein n=1 Tax=Zhongshania arctica TaxID=3238302 RepID=A0ABV3U030_9GAMM